MANTGSSALQNTPAIPITTNPHALIWHEFTVELHTHQISYSFTLSGIKP